MRIFLFKKQEDFSLNRDILKYRIKIPTISLQFRSVSLSLEALLGILIYLILMLAYSISYTPQKYAIWWQFEDYEDFVSYRGGC